MGGNKDYWVFDLNNSLLRDFFSLETERKYLKSIIIDGKLY
jgi:hypothetical protein